MRKWLKRIIVVSLILGVIVGTGSYFGLLKVTPNGVEVMHEDDLTGEELIYRGDLYFRFFRYDDALRLYCRALFNETPSFKEPMKVFRAEDGQVDLAHIADYYDLDVKAKKMPFIPQALFNMGVCYARNGKVKEAMMVFKAFGQLFPRDPLLPLVDRNMESLRLNRM